MTTLEVLPLGRNLSIVTAGSYRWEAEFAAREARLWSVRSRKLFSERVGRGRLTPAQSDRSRQTRGRARFFATATVVFAGMAVEGFLNQYAVIRFGRNASKPPFLGKPTIDKARLLLQAVGARDPGERSELIRRMQRLARHRNDLVHPKTKEVERGDEHQLITDATSIAEGCFEDMEFFFRDFERRDPQARAWTHL